MGREMCDDSFVGERRQPLGAELRRESPREDHRSVGRGMSHQLEEPLQREGRQGR